MRNSIYILTITTLFIFKGCNFNKKMTEPTQQFHGSFTVEHEDIEPPMPGFKSQFKTINEWLIYLSENEKPSKKINNYNIGVFEGQDEYTLCLTGANTYQISDTYEQVRIEYLPKETYFNLPIDMHKGLTRTQVFEYLNNQIEEFVESDQFKNSFFNDAKFLKTEWNGKNLST